MGSQFKKAHKTHALAQRAGVPHASGTGGRGSGSASREQVVLDFAELCALVPEPSARARLLNADEELEAAWSRGERLPLLRARRAVLAHLLRLLAR